MCDHQRQRETEEAQPGPWLLPLPLPSAGIQSDRFLLCWALSQPVRAGLTSASEAAPEKPSSRGGGQSRLAPPHLCTGVPAPARWVWPCPAAVRLPGGHCSPLCLGKGGGQSEQTFRRRAFSDVPPASPPPHLKTRHLAGSPQGWAGHFHSRQVLRPTLPRPSSQLRGATPFRVCPG